ncbi:MAG: OsmC family protein [Spirochaetes bacterium]|nr:OsmC family protein [Spirochaetota bacterium]
MKNEVMTLWAGNMSFEAEVNGHKLPMDLAVEAGGKDEGPRPKPLLLAALTGCSGMDVVSILKKMREPCTWFAMKAEADTFEEHPKKFKSIRLVYQFKKSDRLNPDNVRKACQLSQDKYCGVSAMLKDSAPLSWDIEYID